MYVFCRWALFFLIGLPVQFLIVYPLWILLLPYFLWARRAIKTEAPEIPDAKWSIDDLIQKGRFDRRRLSLFLYYDDTLDRQDDHACLVHKYAWTIGNIFDGYYGLWKLVDTENKTLFRRYPNNSGVPVSGDCLAGFVACATYRHSRGLDIPKRRIKIVLDSYIKNCMGLPAHTLNWKVSNRSSNSGLNYVPDSWGKINQPCVGAQYFTSAGLLRLGTRLFGGKYWLVYFLHYWLMGGWLFSIFPFYYTHKDLIYYAQHITMLGIYSVAKDSINPIYKWSQWWITKFITPNAIAHPLFECYRANCGNSSVGDIVSALDKCMRMKHVWPQEPPSTKDWYFKALSGPMGNIYGVTAGAAKMLRDEL